MNSSSLSHTKWKCQYDIVFIPKYRRKVLYGQVKADVREIIKKLCEYKNIEIFAKNEGIIYYQACAEIYLFKLEFIHLFSEVNLTNPVSSQLYASKLENIKNHLTMAREFYQQADEEPSNQYANVMLDLYETLFEFYTRNKNKTYLKNRLQALHRKCEQQQYKRELRIIDYIIQMNYAVSPSVLKNIISYYPIVAQ